MKAQEHAGGRSARGPATPRRRALLSVEAVVGIAVIGFAALILADAVYDFQRARELSATRQAALWAADAQLRRCEAGVPPDVPMPEGMIDGRIRLDTDAMPGEGDWTGLTRVTVTATATLPWGGEVHESVQGYVREVTP